MQDYLEGCQVTADPSEALHSLLSQIQTETAMLDPELGDSADPANTGDEHEEEDPDMKELVKASKQDTEVEKISEYLPATLAEALGLNGCRWNALFRFVVRLRCAPGGSDLRWVPNGRRSRRSAAKLNWHQHLGEGW